MTARSKSFSPQAAVALLLFLAAFTIAGIVRHGRKFDSVVIASQVMSPGTLVLSGDRLFFTAFVGEGKSLRAIFSTAPASGELTRLAASPMELPSLAVDAGYAYYAAYAEDSVMRVPVAGGAATPLVRGQRHPLAVVRGADALYYSARVLGGRSIFKLALAGGAPHEVHSGLAELTAMVADPDAVYAATADEVVRVSGGTSTTLTPGAGRITALALQGDALLIATSSTPPAVLSLPASGGAATRLFALKAPATALAADATHVYVATGDAEDTVLAGPIAGGDPRVIASNPARPSSIAVDDKFVYFAIGDKNGKVLRVSKP